MTITMSSLNLDYLIIEFPEEKSSIKRLYEYINSSIEKGRPRELTVQRLFDLIQPSSLRVLAKMLQLLVNHGVFKKIVRVESDSLGGIGNYQSLTEVPSVIFDSRIGHEIEVRLDQIQVIYRLEVS